MNVLKSCTPCGFFCLILHLELVFMLHSVLGLVVEELLLLILNYFCVLSFIYIIKFSFFYSSLVALSFVQLNLLAVFLWIKITVIFNSGICSFRNLPEPFQKVTIGGRLCVKYYVLVIRGFLSVLALLSAWSSTLF